LVPTINLLSYTTEDLTTQAIYKFKVQAFNSYGYSDFSDEIAILCAALPD
jgi:hypothetical protein